MDVFVAETVEDHAAGYIIGAWSSLALAEAAVVATHFKGYRKIQRDADDDGLSLEAGDRFSGPCVDIRRMEVDSIQPPEGLGTGPR